MQHVYEAPLSVDFEMDAKEGVCAENTNFRFPKNDSRFRKNAVVSRYGSSASLSENLPRSTSIPVLSNIVDCGPKSRKLSLQDDFTYQRNNELQ